MPLVEVLSEKDWTRLDDDVELAETNSERVPEASEMIEDEVDSLEDMFCTVAVANRVVIPEVTVTTGP